MIVLGYILYSEGRKIDTTHPSNTMETSTSSESEGTTISYDLPSDLYFAGERVPLEIPDVKERLDREIHINVYWHNNTIFMIKRANRWLPQIEKILAENNIPDDFKYLAVIESALINDVSYKSAVGFWQFLRPTAKEFGLEVNPEVDERYHQLKSTAAATRYLNKAYKKFGSWTTVAASYDRGMAGMQRALNNQKVESYYDLLLNQETSRYVFRILAAKEILSNPEKYGFNIPPEHLYEQEDLDEIEVQSSIPDLVVFAQENGINYKILKRYNPWLRSKKLTLKRGSTYQIAIPRNPVEAASITAP